MCALSSHKVTSCSFTFTLTLTQPSLAPTTPPPPLAPFSLLVWNIRIYIWHAFGNSFDVFFFFFVIIVSERRECVHSSGVRSLTNEWMNDDYVRVAYIAFIRAVEHTRVHAPFNAYFESLHAFNPTEKSISLYVSLFFILLIRQHTFSADSQIFGFLSIYEYVYVCNMYERY